jgi:hypothetical protein
MATNAGQLFCESFRRLVSIPDKSVASSQMSGHGVNQDLPRKLSLFVDLAHGTT